MRRDTTGRYSAVQNIDAQMALKQRNETLDVHSARLSSDVADLAINGTVENLNDPRLELTVISKIHLKPASQYLSLEQTIEGDLNVDASVKGRPEGIESGRPPQR